MTGAAAHHPEHLASCTPAAAPSLPTLSTCDECRRRTATGNLLTHSTGRTLCANCWTGPPAQPPRASPSPTAFVIRCDDCGEYVAYSQTLATTKGPRRCLRCWTRPPRDAQAPPATPLSAISAGGASPLNEVTP